MQVSSLNSVGICCGLSVDGAACHYAVAKDVATVHCLLRVQLCFGGLCATYDIEASVCAAFTYHKDYSNVLLFNNETEIRFVILGFILMYQKFANVIRSDIRI